MSSLNLTEFLILELSHVKFYDFQSSSFGTEYWKLEESDCTVAVAYLKQGRREGGEAVIFTGARDSKGAREREFYLMLSPFLLF